jgi:hypothetical protein
MLVTLAIMGGSIMIVGMIENRRTAASLALMRAKFEGEDAEDEE